MRNLESLPGGCTLIAARKAWELSREAGVKSRILSYYDPRSKRHHSQLIFRVPSGEFFAYEPSEEGGSLSLGKLNGSATLHREFAAAISKATCRACQDAKWETEL